MIVRVWRGRVAEGHERAYMEHLTRRVFPAFRTVDGFLGGELLRERRGDSVDFLVMTRWASIEAVRRFAGPDATKAMVEPAAEAILVQFDRVVKHYELAVEIAAGRV